MSIKSLFEDVADAIRVTSGSDDTYTPAEMPQAIRNFSSIFQTKTLSSPIGGQTTVEGCLSSLSSDLSELESNVTIKSEELTISTDALGRYFSQISITKPIISAYIKSEDDRLVIPNKYIQGTWCFVVLNLTSGGLTYYANQSNKQLIVYYYDDPKYN